MTPAQHPNSSCAEHLPSCRRGISRMCCCTSWLTKLLHNARKSWRKCDEGGRGGRVEGLGFGVKLQVVFELGDREVISIV